MEAPLIELHLGSPTPAYRQIADGLRRHLVANRIRPGQLLPPVRQLALDLGVHFNTVAQAYRILEAEGWLNLKRRRGALVVDRTTPRKPDRSHVDDILRRLRGLAAELRSAGLSQADVRLALRELTKEGET
jgi:GntR family transcriptional regulator